MRGQRPAQLSRCCDKLLDGLRDPSISSAVPIGRLMRDAGTRSEQSAPPTSRSPFDDVRARRGAPGAASPTAPRSLTSRTLDELVGARLFAEGRDVPARGRLQVPRRLQRDLLARSGGAGAAACARSRRATMPRRWRWRPGCAARQAVILMPSDAPALKRAATEGYGAEVVEFDRYGEDREQLRARAGRRARPGARAPVRQSPGDGRPGHGGARAARRGPASSTRWWCRSAAAG